MVVKYGSEYPVVVWRRSSVVVGFVEAQNTKQTDGARRGTFTFLARLVRLVSSGYHETRLHWSTVLEELSDHWALKG
jgi:hypothetical protein